MGKRQIEKWVQGLPWRSSGWDSALPLQGTQVRFLAGELRSGMLCRADKKIEKKRKKEKWMHGETARERKKESKQGRE